MIYIWNTLICIAYAICILFSEAFCISSLVWFYDWSFEMDLLIVICFAFVLVIHYTCMVLLQTKNILLRSTMLVLLFFDIVISVGILLFLLAYTFDVLSWRMLFVFIIQVALVFLRYYAHSREYLMLK